MLPVGFGKVDITPRVGVELSGYGAYRNRHSTGVRDRLYARAAAFGADDEAVVLVSCDLIGLRDECIAEVRERLAAARGLPAHRIMVHCTHTHSGPATAAYCGWGEPDPPYLHLLPRRIEAACRAALDARAPAAFGYACVPCEGIGINRVRDRFSCPLEEIADPAWRPALPEWTDTACHVITLSRAGRTFGWLASFGCHPVVGGSGSHQIHGDFCGVAMNSLEAEHGGATGLFLQGAQGDVNSAIVASVEAESLTALDILGARFAAAVRQGLAQATPCDAAPVRMASRWASFSRIPLSREMLLERLGAEEAVLGAPDADDGDNAFRLALVKATAYRRLLERLERGADLAPAVELQGLRLGPLVFLGSPFEVMQGIKNEVVEKARSPIPVVLGLTAGSYGYAPDREAASAGGYEADLVPLICGVLPFTRIHDELVRELLALEAALLD